MMRTTPSTVSPWFMDRSLTRPAWLRWMPLMLIWLLAVALRIWLLQDPRVVWGDEPFYLWLGRNWVTGRGFSFTGHPDVHHGPLFPLFAGLLYLVTGDLTVASNILYALFGSLLVWIVYAIGVELYGRRAGLVAAALTAVFPSLSAAVLHWGSLTEPIYMFFVYLGLWSVLLALRPAWRGASSGQAEHHHLWSYALAGLALGLAYLTRPEAIGYWVIGGVFMLLVRLIQRRFNERRFWGGLLLYLLAFGLAFMPYAYYTRLNTGAWMISEKVGVAYLTGIGLAHGDTAAFDKSTWGLDSTGLETFFFSSESYNVSMLNLVLADPKTFITILYLNAIRFVQVLIDWSLFPYVLLPLAALGLFQRGWSRERCLKELLLLGSMLPVIGFVLFFIQARYIVPLIPVLILWTANGLLGLGEWLAGTVAALRTPEGQSPATHTRPVASGLWSRVLAYGPTVLVLVLLLGAQRLVVQQVTDVGSVRPEHRSVGEYLAGIVPPDAVIMARYPAIAYHAGANWVPTPNATWPEILKYARHKRARYLVIDERELRYRPQLQNLIQDEQPPAPLKQLYETEAGGERLVVYEFVE